MKGKEIPTPQIYKVTSTRPSAPGAPFCKVGNKYVISSHGCLYRPVRNLF